MIIKITKFLLVCFLLISNPIKATLNKELAIKSLELAFINNCLILKELRSEESRILDDQILLINMFALFLKAQEAFPGDPNLNYYEQTLVKTIRLRQDLFQDRLTQKLEETLLKFDFINAHIFMAHSDLKAATGGDLIECQINLAELHTRLNENIREIISSNNLLLISKFIEVFMLDQVLKSKLQKSLEERGETCIHAPNISTLTYQLIRDMITVMGIKIDPNSPDILEFRSSPNSHVFKRFSKRELLTTIGQVNYCSAERIIDHWQTISASQAEQETLLETMRMHLNMFYEYTTSRSVFIKKFYDLFNATNKIAQACLLPMARIDFKTCSSTRPF